MKYEHKTKIVKVMAIDSKVYGVVKKRITYKQVLKILGNLRVYFG